MKITKNAHRMLVQKCQGKIMTLGKMELRKWKMKKIPMTTICPTINSIAF